MKSKEIKEYLEKGYLYINVLFEIVGNPKEHVEAMLKRVIDGVKTNKDIVLFKEDYGEVKDAGDGLWGTFCESEMLVKDIKTISWISFNFSPASIEVREPKELLLKDKDLSSFFGELLSALHQNNMIAVKAKSDSKNLLLNFNKLVRNAVAISLKERDKTSEEIGKSIGLDEKGINSVLEAMIKEKTIEKQGDIYTNKK